MMMPFSKLTTLWNQMRGRIFSIESLKAELHPDLQLARQLNIRAGTYYYKGLENVRRGVDLLREHIDVNLPQNRQLLVAYLIRDIFGMKERTEKYPFHSDLPPAEILKALFDKETIKLAQKIYQSWGDEPSSLSAEVKIIHLTSQIISLIDFEDENALGFIRKAEGLNKYYKSPREIEKQERDMDRFFNEMNYPLSVKSADFEEKYRGEIPSLDALFLEKLADAQTLVNSWQAHIDGYFKNPQISSLTPETLAYV